MTKYFLISKVECGCESRLLGNVERMHEKKSPLVKIKFGKSSLLMARGNAQFLSSQTGLFLPSQGH